MKIAKIFATGISGDIRSEFTVYNVKDVKTIKLTDQCKCYQFLGCEKGKAQAIYLHKTSDVFFRLIPDIEDIITIIEQEYSELSKAYQEKEKIYSSNPTTKTAQLYAYSFDRETWQGDFNSREEAMQAAMNDEHNKGCLVVYTGIAKLYTPALKSETVLDILKIEADEIAGIAAADWLKLEDISEEARSEIEKTLTAAVMKWLEKHSLKPDFYESISSVQAHGIDDYFKKK